MVFVPKLAGHFRWRRDSGLLVPWRDYDYAIQLQSERVHYQLTCDHECQRALIRLFFFGDPIPEQIRQRLGMELA